jgi:hypothetical protein
MWTPAAGGSDNRLRRELHAAAGTRQGTTRKDSLCASSLGRTTSSCFLGRGRVAALAPLTRGPAGTLRDASASWTDHSLHIVWVPFVPLQRPEVAAVNRRSFCLLVDVDKTLAH